MSSDAVTTPAAGTGPADDEGLPQPPVLVVRCDPVRGVVRARGWLDTVGAEVVAAQVDALHLAGHREIAVRLAQADVGARALLGAQAARLATAGVRVRLAAGSA
ncbi:hypothetical protein ACI797_01855 [Geodermatophilus sp. SYSU D00691]